MAVNRTSSKTLVSVVFDLESGPPAVPIGTYDGADEDLILYRTPQGDQRSAPADCVLVVDVDLFPRPAETAKEITRRLNQRRQNGDLIAEADVEAALNGTPS